MTGKKTRWSKEKILELFEQNEIKNTSELQKIAPGAAIYCWRKGIMDELPFSQRTNIRTKKKTHDITKVIHYLERWAKEENTSVQTQASKYGYVLEYKEYIENKNK